MNNPSIRVDERIFMLDCARKYFTPCWINNDRIKGAGFCLWTDTPSAETEDELLENMRPYFTAIAKKST